MSAKQQETSTALSSSDGSSSSPIQVLMVAAMALAVVAFAVFLGLRKNASSEQAADHLIRAFLEETPGEIVQPSDEDEILLSEPIFVEETELLQESTAGFSGPAHGWPTPSPTSSTLPLAAAVLPTPTVVAQTESHGVDTAAESQTAQNQHDQTVEHTANSDTANATAAPAIAQPIATPIPVSQHPVSSFDTNQAAESQSSQTSGSENQSNVAAQPTTPFATPTAIGGFDVVTQPNSGGHSSQTPTGESQGNSTQPSATPLPTAIRSVMSEPEMRAYVMGELNKVRANAGLPQFILSPELEAIAQDWSIKMAAAGGISHRPSDQMSAMVPVGWATWGENVGSGTNIPITQTGLEGSPLHYQNMVNPAFTHVGVGVYYANGLVWITQNFLGY